MESLTIRKLDGEVKRRLRQRAASEGVSMEEEARRALRSWVNRPAREGGGLGTRLRARFEALGGVELEIAPGGPSRRLPDIFDE